MMYIRTAALLLLTLTAPAALAQDEQVEPESVDTDESSGDTDTGAEEDESAVTKKKKKKKKEKDIVRTLDFETFTWSSVTLSQRTEHPDGSVTTGSEATRSLANDYDSSFALTLEHPGWFMRLSRGAATETGRPAHLYAGRQIGIRTYGVAFRYLDAEESEHENHGADTKTVTKNSHWMLGPYFKINSKRAGERFEGEAWLALGATAASGSEDGQVTSSTDLSGWVLATRLTYVRPLNPKSDLPVFYTGGLTYQYESDRAEYGQAGDRQSARLSLHQLSLRLLGLRLHF
jgi:hypothetical protein